MGHSAAVLTDQHEYCTEHDLAAILSGSTSTKLLTDADVGDVADANRCTIHTGDHDVGDVFDVADLARCTNEQLLTITLDVTGAYVGVVAFQRGYQIIQGQLVGSQALRIRRNQELLGKATDGIDLCHARYVAQLRLDDPVLDYPQVGGRVGRTVFFDRALFGFNGPQENFAEAG
ncbi:hypothetical protein D3C76_572610 [compost metagenome]